jgi:hypothetical protein
MLADSSPEAFRLEYQCSAVHFVDVIVYHDYPPY